MSGSITGILLMAHGGPDGLDDVEPFLNHIMKGRTPSPELVAEIRDRYRLIGGRSPLREITERQASALERALRDQGLNLTVYVGMRHWHPFIQDTYKRIVSDGTRRLVALSLAPHYSKMSVGAYFDALETARRENVVSPEIVQIRSYCDHPLLLQAIAERIEQALSGIPDDARRSLRLLFTAHSLPERILQEGDPYPKELQATVQGVLKRIPALPWDFAYQSRGRIPGAWLGPEVDAMIPKLAAEGCRHVLIIPVGFVSDHIEVLYDIDILYKELADKAGICLYRTASLNDHPTFISALADLVKRVLTLPL
ncbi:MAG TPA: ferrochelatase [Nitrospiria bacterium]|nr:ferrochelatase [Nitrospiria bacterium]